MKIVMQRLSDTLPDTREIRQLVSQNRILAALAGLFLLGTACGALLSKSAGAEVLSKLDFLFNSNYAVRNGTPPITIFLASAASSFLFVFACFLCGLSVWGVFFAPLVPAVRGVGLGMTAGYLYAAFGVHGALFYAAVLLPGAFCSCLAILHAARDALLFSRRLTQAGLSDRGEKPRLLDYLSQYAYTLLLLFLAAGIDVLCSWAFAGFMINWLS